jgi:hypothetical protein
MEPQEARKWMKMCVDSGLWVPSNSNEFEGQGGEEGEGEEGEEEKGQVEEEA